MMLRGSNSPRFAGHDMSTQRKIFLNFLRHTVVSVLSDYKSGMVYNEQLQTIHLFTEK